MPLVNALLRRLGNAGAVANAEVELELVRRRSAQVDLLTHRLSLQVAAPAAVAA